MPETLPNHALYLHIPFCRHRCAYCDFNTYAGLESLVDDYVDALCLEMSFAAKAAQTLISIHTIFLGGGTPSLLSPTQLERILQAAHAHFVWQPNIEITMEANPGTLSLEYLRDVRGLGINRLSMGVQSTEAQDLRVLEREHDFFDVIQAVSSARLAGFQNISLDLIFGIPYQTLQSWQKTLRAALKLAPDHFSLYSLILEMGTPMEKWVGRGLLTAPDDDLAADMYEWAIEEMAQAGYYHYEISNWAARPAASTPNVPLYDFRCQHNLQYWRYQPWLGLGAGAHGYVGDYRTANVLAPAAYIKRLRNGKPRTYPRTPATVNVHPINTVSAQGETMMMGLRLLEEGVSNQRFVARFGEGIADAFPEQLRELFGYELLEWRDNDRLCLTERGKMLGNQVFMRFV
jgi:oxygen-independent coproporphyrinogen-3 oxidase